MSKKRKDLVHFYIVSENYVSKQYSLPWMKYLEGPKVIHFYSIYILVSNVVSYIKGPFIMPFPFFWAFCLSIRIFVRLSLYIAVLWTDCSCLFGIAARVFMYRFIYIPWLLLYILLYIIISLILNTIEIGYLMQTSCSKVIKNTKWFFDNHDTSLCCFFQIKLKITRLGSSIKFLTQYSCTNSALKNCKLDWNSYQ